MVAMCERLPIIPCRPGKDVDCSLYCDKVKLAAFRPAIERGAPPIA